MSHRGVYGEGVGGWAEPSQGWTRRPWGQELRNMPLRLLSSQGSQLQGEAAGPWGLLPTHLWGSGRREAGTLSTVPTTRDQGEVIL